jgi:hypothetical protein
MKSPSFIGISSDETRQSPRDDGLAVTRRAIEIPVCRIAVRAGRVSRAASDRTLQHACPASKTDVGAARAGEFERLGSGAGDFYPVRRRGRCPEAGAIASIALLPR